MKFKDGKTIYAYVRSKLHNGYITLFLFHFIAELSKTLKKISVTIFRSFYCLRITIFLILYHPKHGRPAGGFIVIIFP